jgi:hypothetical protein
MVDADLDQNRQIIEIVHKDLTTESQSTGAMG